MKPQIVGNLDGHHNKDIGVTSARLLKGNSWKKQRIVTIIPTDSLMPAKAALAIWNLVYPPNQSGIRILAQGMEVGEAYSSTIEQILAHPELTNWEYILTIEHDNIPPNDGLMNLINRLEERKDLACISGLYFTKGEGGIAQIWGDVTDPIHNSRPQVPIPGQVIECYGVGMGFALWRLKMFKDEKLRKPWFKTVADKTGMGTQDLYFWADARKYGYKCAVDCSVMVGHYDHVNDMVW